MGAETGAAVEAASGAASGAASDILSLLASTTSTTTIPTTTIPTTTDTTTTSTTTTVPTTTVPTTTVPTTTTTDPLSSIIRNSSAIAPPSGPTVQPSPSFSPDDIAEIKEQLKKNSEALKTVIDGLQQIFNQIVLNGQATTTDVSDANEYGEGEVENIGSMQEGGARRRRRYSRRSPRAHKSIHTTRRRQ